MKFTKKYVQQLLQKQEDYISELCDAILYYEKKEDYQYADDIFWRLFEMNTEIFMDAMLKDLYRRNYIVTDNLLYNAIWYSFSNNPEMKTMMIEKINCSSTKQEIINFLTTLVEDMTNVGQKNIADLVKEMQD